jgi:hypothetical protein
MRLSDQQRKLIMLALDPGASAGEVDNAARAFIKGLRKEYRDGHEFMAALGNGGPAVPKPREGTNYGDVMLTFGKHRGKLIKEVDPGYLMMALDTIPAHRISKYTRIAMQRFLRDEKYRD